MSTIGIFLGISTLEEIHIEVKNREIGSLKTIHA